MAQESGDDLHFVVSLVDEPQRAWTFDEVPPPNGETGQVFAVVGTDDGAPAREVYAADDAFLAGLRRRREATRGSDGG